MIAVTIGIGEAYKKLAEHAAQAVHEMTGLKTLILDDQHFTRSGLPHPHHLKLRLFDLVNDDTIMFFDSDMDFFEGRSKPPFDWQIQIDEKEMDRLKNQKIRVKDGRREKSLLLNSDGTIGPPFYPGMGCYWFTRKRSATPGLTIASQKEMLEEFTRVDENAWESVQELRPARH